MDWWRRAVFAGVLTAAASCTGDEPPGDDDDDDTGRCLAGAPAVASDALGTWFTSNRWDLSPPLAQNGRAGVGPAVAVRLAYNAAPRAGVPDPQSELAPEIIEEAIYAPVVELIHGGLPADLRPDGASIAALTAAFGDAEVDTTLVYGTSSSTEEITRMVLHGDSDYDVPVAALTQDGTEWRGGPHYPSTIEGTRSFHVHYGDLIRLAAEGMLGVDLWSFDLEIDSAVDCPAIVELTTGAAGTFSFEVEGQSYQIAAADLLSACEEAKAEVRELVLGYLGPDGEVLFYGCLDKLDDDGDGVADRLLSRDYSGDVNDVGGARVTGSTTAVRQPPAATSSGGS